MPHRKANQSLQTDLKNFIQLNRSQFPIFLQTIERIERFETQLLVNKNVNKYITSNSNETILSVLFLNAENSLLRLFCFFLLLSK